MRLVRAQGHAAAPRPAYVSQACANIDDPTWRRIDCRFYDVCLSWAEAQAWESWTCRQCMVRAELTDDQRKQQNLGVARAIAALTDPDA